MNDGKPVVAILTVGDKTRLFRGNHKNFRDIIRTGNDMGYLAYVVTVRDLKLGRPTISGYVPGPGKTWIAAELPSPNVIYNRIPAREDEVKPAVAHKIAECLEYPGIRLYNPYFFNKWNLFEWLKESRAAFRHVPATKRLRSARSLSVMLKNHHGLYLKPESGKAGKGIMRIRFSEESPLPYRLQIQSEKRSATYKSGSMDRLWARIVREAGRTHYIVQEMIELATYKGRPFDLRVLLQKNGRGGWGVTGIGARLAGARSITTHVPRGGSVENPSSMLEAMFGPEKASTILKNAATATLLIARQIERSSGYTLGEMSMDLGVDHKGGLWFFEANSRPMKFDEPEIRKLSLERIFQYSQYLVRQSAGSR
ncbi:YheC/YheD family protein [Paenibacillus sp. HN-1]|nr:YheC/YheD family protein [Paenibacillus sp. CGMCC 1.18879]MBY9082975.1 YheC/YheD family protein [Paenibacillus sinensis]